MAFAAGFLGPPSPRISSSRTTRTSHVEDYDSSSSAESTETARSHHSQPRTRVPFPASTATGSSGPNFLLPLLGGSGRSSSTSTPVPSRSSSPLPHFFSSVPSSSCTSDTESEPNSPLIGGRPRSPWWREDRRRWWNIGRNVRSRSHRKRHGGYLRTIRKCVRRLLRHPLFPRQPITIVRDTKHLLGAGLTCYRTGLDSPSAYKLLHLPHTITITYTQPRQGTFTMASILFNTTSIVRAAGHVSIKFDFVLSSTRHRHNASAIPTSEPGLITTRRLVRGCFLYGFRI
jgi:hypothetical protein